MTYTAGQLRGIANLIDALDKADPPDIGREAVEVFIKGAIRLTNRDEEDLGSIADLDGLGYFWTPASDAHAHG